MVLEGLQKSVGTATLVAAFVSLFSVNAEAQNRSKAIRGLFRYRIENSTCTLRQKSEGAWQVYRGPKLKRGSVVVGKPSPRANDIVVFRSRQAPRMILAGRKSCLFEKDTPAEELNLGNRYKFQASLGIISWQENLKLKISGDETSTTLRSTQLAICPGLNLLRIRDTYDYGMGACAFYGKSQAGRSAPVDETTGDNTKYAVKNVDVFGASFTPRFLWRPKSGAVAFGATTPVMFRYGNWPVLDTAAATIGPKFWFLIGLALEARLERGSYFFSQRVGFLNLPKSLNWALEGGYTF